MKTLFLSFILLTMSRAGLCGQWDSPVINHFVVPVIRGDTLYISGEIETHIYDMISRAGSEMKAVKTIDLNSEGGDLNAALDLAQKIQSLHVTTKVSKGSICASSCLLLFAAGRERIANESSQFGVHGVRVEVSIGETFYRTCGAERGFSPKGVKCQKFLSQLIPRIKNATNNYFGTLEKLGVSADLQTGYESLPDDPQWFENRNLLRKPDYKLTAQEAYRVNLVTQIEPVVTAGVSPP